MPAPLSALSRLRLPDALALGTTGAMLAVVAFGWGRLVDPGQELLLHGLSLVLLAAGVLGGRSGRPMRDNLARVPGYLAWGYLYHRAAGVLIEELPLPTYERALSAMDHALFGGDVSLLLQTLHTPALTEAAQLAYTSYYVVLLALPLALAIRGRHAEMTVVMGLFVLAHTLLVIGNTAVPARWPVLLYQDPALADVIVYPFPTEGLYFTASLRAGIESGTRMLWDSMPSGHTCISLLMTMAAARYMPRLLWVMVPLTCGIVFGTLYLRYHYGVDILAGVALALSVRTFGPRALAAWDRAVAPHPGIAAR